MDKKKLKEQVDATSGEIEDRSPLDVLLQIRIGDLKNRMHSEPEVMTLRLIACRLGIDN